MNLCHKSRIRCASVRKGVPLRKTRSHRSSIVGAVPMWRPKISLASFCLLCSGAMLGVPATESGAIEVSPTDAQVEQAVEQGLRAAKDRVLPNRLYAWFGSDEELRPKGFLMTKMNGLTVMASHFGLRGETPSKTEIRRILAEETMLVSVTIFGEIRTFADNCYIVLKQGEKLVKPLKVRFDGVAQRTKSGPRLRATRPRSSAPFGMTRSTRMRRPRSWCFQAKGKRSCSTWSFLIFHRDIAGFSPNQEKRVFQPCVPQ